MINDFRFYSGKVVDKNGDPNGLKLTVRSWTPQFFWNPNVQFLGANYGMGVVLPIAYTSLENTGVTGFGFNLATDNSLGTGNVLLKPLYLSWTLAPNFFVSTGFGIYAPTGSYRTPAYWLTSAGQTFPGNAGNPFWTFQPEIGMSFFKPGPDGYNLSANMFYLTNTENHNTQYKSGDQILINFTATKAIGPVSVGAVGFFKKQVTADVDNGHWFAPNGQHVPGAPAFVFFPVVDVTNVQQKFGIGPTISGRIGSALVDFSWMHDFNTISDVRGDTFLLHVKFLGFFGGEKPKI